MSRLAITGGTGFVGGNLLGAAVAAGHAVRALARRPQPPRAGVEWVAGSLEDEGSLARLVDGADAVIHVAGVIKGTPEQLVQGNVAGTAAVVRAAERSGAARLIHVSSLAAREPMLSSYGRSKNEAEVAAALFPGAWTIVRPPAIYGPGERDVFELFRLARRGIVPLPSLGRLSIIAVSDLVALLLACLTAPGGALYEADDGRAGGWKNTMFARALGTALGRRVLPLPLPRLALTLAARADGLLRGSDARLTPDRVAYYAHPDWAVNSARRPPADLWRPTVDTAAGLAETARWYRAHNWL